MLDHVPNHVLDYIIIGLVTTALQLSSSLPLAPTNEEFSYLQLGKKLPNPTGERGGKSVLL